MQTLAEGREGPSFNFEGRTAYLRDQLEHAEAHIVAIQEVRTSRAECFLSGNFIRLCSGATPTGQLGVEIWFRQRTAHSRQGFSSDDVTVLFWDPRSIGVRVKSQCLEAVFVAVHAPTAQDPDRQTWWTQLRQKIAEVSSGLVVCVLGDFNTRFDEKVSCRIGGHVWPSRFGVPQALYSLLTEQDLWLPSTFEGLHCGQHETWFAPGQQAAARLDYVAIPSQWTVEENGSAVMLDFDPGHHSVDHFAIRLDVWVRGPEKFSRAGKVPRFDREKMASEEGQRSLRRICEQAPLLPWNLDADAHYQQLQEYLFDRISVEFKQPRHSKPGSFLSEATWILREHRIWLRKQVIVLRCRSRHLGVTVAFGVWSRLKTWGVCWTLATANLCQMSRKAVGLVARLRETKKELRLAIRRDRQQWMHSLAAAAGDLPVRDVVQKLRPLLRCSGRKQGFRRALPAVLLESGQLAASPEEAVERWVRHFSAIEGGTVCTEGLVEQRRARLRDGNRESVDILPGEIPNRVELERALQQTACHKACGPDGVPGELLKFGHGCISKCLYQLLLKLTVRNDEATIMKGGLQYHIWKGKGAPNLCENHRGILVSSVIAKSLHAVVRKKCLPAFCSSASTMQVGGLPRRPVTYAAHAIRLFQSLHAKKNYFLIFLDLRDAFYRVVRPFLTSEIPSDESIAATFRALKLPPASFQAFCAQVSQDSVISRSGGSEWLQSVVTETLTGTWFKLPSQVCCCQHE